MVTEKIAFDDITPQLFGIGLFRHCLRTPNNENLKNTYTHRFMAMLDGSAELVMNGRVQKMGKNDILYLCPGQSYAILNKFGDFYVMNVYFDFIKYRERGSISMMTLLNREFDVTKSGKLFTVVGAEFYNESKLIKNDVAGIEELRELNGEYSGQSAYCRLFTNVTLARFIIKLARRYVGAENSADGAGKAIVDYINANFAALLSPSALSQIFGYHPGYINIIVKKMTGLTLHRYIQGVKIRRAAELLCETDMTVTDIAQYLSFCDSSHFSKVFFRHVGLYPSQLRKRD